MAPELSVVIPTCPDRVHQLQRLLDGIAGSRAESGCVEIIVIVDDGDDGPLEVAAASLGAIPFTGLTQSPGGPAQARNRGIESARGDWLLFLDDDAVVDAGTLGGHLHRIRRHYNGRDAFIGQVYWPEKLLASPWGRLLAGTSMVLFQNQMVAEQRYGFRHFCTSNLSVRRDMVLKAGGFDRRFRHAMHEDIELGWRLQQAFGTQVLYAPEIRSWHDHELLPRDYFRREHRSGDAARVAREINAGFFESVWNWLGDPARTLAVLRELFGPSARRARALLEAWITLSPRSVAAADLQTMYLAHLPLKRMSFCQGYLQKPFEELWLTWSDQTSPAP